MSPSQAFVEQLLGLSELTEQRHLLALHLPTLATNEVAEDLREKVLEFLRKETSRAAVCAELVLYLGNLTGNLAHHALGLRLQAMVLSLGQGQYAEAISLYDQALAHYQALADPVGEARVHITRVWSAAQVGESYATLLEEAQTARPVLEAHQEWRDLATLQNNLGIIQRRFGRHREALDSFHKARAAYLALGETGVPFLANNANNLAFTHYVLGQYKAATEAGEQALATATHLQQHIVAARANHNLGLTYYGLGHYSRALQLFEKARQVWLAEKKYHEVVQNELTATYCLLQLRRFYDVLTKCADARELITQHQAQPETWYSLLNEAKAYSLLGQYDEALATLAAVRQIIAQHSSPWDLAQADLTEAILLFLQGQYEQARTTAQASVTAFQSLTSPIEVGQSHLLLARIAIQRGRFAEARRNARQALRIAATSDHPGLRYETYFIQGQLEQAKGNDSEALQYYQQALTDLEQLQRRTMLEDRADFLADTDKETLYQEAIGLSLASEQTEQAFVFLERMKSRALMDLLTNRVDIRVHSRTAGDAHLVDRFNQLRGERDEFYRHLEQGADLPTKEKQELIHKRLGHEREMTDLRRQLLVHHADYAYDAALMPVPAVALPYTCLDSETLLLEYCLLRRKWVVFLASADSLHCHPLEATAEQINQLSTALQLNLRLAGRTPPNHITHLIPNAQSLLRQLYDCLLAPVAPYLSAYRRLIIVPQGQLHYLPFHALFNGRHYLTELHPISYLPAASFLHYSRQTRPTGVGLLAIGYSHRDQLPYTLTEAQSIAALWEQSHLLIAEQATIANMRDLAAHFDLLHVATHGVFRPDNPLFSGLALADGWLTTLDIFNLQLNASLVTLSACYTGQHVIGGGDELLGLARAFLSAGATSILLTHWAVADVVTAELIGRFYQQLRQGASKDEAMQAAQCWLMQSASDSTLPACYAHPYFWSPFYLIGDGRPLL